MAKKTPKITELTQSQVARILATAGERRITAAMIQVDIDAGAPANTDGTMNLIHYVAWLARENAT